MADEVIDYKTDGTIRIISGSVQLRIKRPIAGQFRELNEAWSRVVETERDAIAALDLAPTDDEEAQVSARRAKDDAVHGAIYDWWREVARMLDERGGKFPDDDDEMPIWLLNVETVNEAFGHWKSVPWVPGRRPSVREAEEMGPMLEKLQSILALVPQASQGPDSSAS